MNTLLDKSNHSPSMNSKLGQNRNFF